MGGKGTGKDTNDEIGDGPNRGFGGDWLAEVDHPLAAVSGRPPGGRQRIAAAGRGDPEPRPDDDRASTGELLVLVLVLPLLVAVGAALSAQLAPLLVRAAVEPPVAAPAVARAYEEMSAPAPPKRAGRGSARIPHETIYRRAGSDYRIDWRLLAAIGKLETNHGRLALPGVRSGVNTAGCCSGPMQICTAGSCGDAFDRYGVDGDGDGRIDVYAPADAIPSAAHLLAALRDTLRAGIGSAPPTLLLAAYNAGPGAVTAAAGVPDYPETRAYVARGRRIIARLGS